MPLAHLPSLKANPYIVHLLESLMCDDLAIVAAVVATVVATIISVANAVAEAMRDALAL